MADSSGEPDAFMRNVRLSICWPVILAFVVNPLFAAGWFGYAVCYQSDDGLLSRHWQMKLPLLYFIVSVGMGCGVALNHVTKRLSELGYEQRQTAPLTADWFLSVGILWGHTYWLSQQDWEGVSDRMAIFHMVTNGVTFWLGLMFAFLGPVWYFTVRVRQS